MSLKIFKAFWFLSVLAVLANLLLTYMSLPETLIIQNTETPITVSRDGFFYAMTAIVTLVNAMVYLVSKVFRKNIDLRAWFHGQVIALNIFFIIAINFVGLYNSGERYDYANIRFIIYGSVGLFVIWALGWPIYLIYKKLFIKPSI